MSTTPTNPITGDVSGSGNTTREQVVLALQTLCTSPDRASRSAANAYLESFQKQPEAWSITHEILTDTTSPSSSAEAQLFAAQTLRTKLQLDYHQLPANAAAPLRDAIVQLVRAHADGTTAAASGGKAIRTALCVALATLALNMADWHTPLQDVTSVLVGDLSTASAAAPGTNDSATAAARWEALLQFVSVLPEEVNESRRSRLSEEQLQERIRRLLQDNAEEVLRLLIASVESTRAAGKSSPLVFACLNSWLREIPVGRVVQTPLLDMTFAALADDELFDAAVDLICGMLRETTEVNEPEVVQVIEVLYPRIMTLQPKLRENSSDPDAFRGYARIFSEAGEAWVILVARLPDQFEPLVRAIAETTGIDDDLEIVKFTFNFWYDLKQALVSPKHAHAKAVYTPIYTGLVDAMVRHLHYPSGDDVDESDLFDGDREAEEKFRSFRHDMGDVLKDCCNVVGGRECLARVYQQVSALLEQGQAGSVRWQQIEALLFSMRAMAREISLDEADVLPHIMGMLLNLPEHPKIRYAATLVLGRYTEWTARHPDYLLPQLNYITSGFSESDVDVTSAAAQALKHFCRDCSQLLVEHVEQLYGFYGQVQPSLDFESSVEVTEGVGHVVAAQPVDRQYAALSAFTRPIGDRLEARCTGAPTDDDKELRKLADDIELLTVFAFTVVPRVDPGPATEHPCVKVYSELWHVLEKVLDVYGKVSFIAERVCSCMKAQLQSYRSHMAILLPSFAERLAGDFDRLRYGCFLWVSGACVRQFADAEYNTPETVDAVWRFVQGQSVALFQTLSSKGGDSQQMPDIVEDFFRLQIDALFANPVRSLAEPAAGSTTDLLDTTVLAALVCLRVRQWDALRTVLHFLRDLTAWTSPETQPSTTTPIDDVSRRHLTTVLAKHVEPMTRLLFVGIAHEYPRDGIPEASGVLLSLLMFDAQSTVAAIAAALTAATPSPATVAVLGDAGAEWVSLDVESMGDDERQRLMNSLVAACREGEYRKARSLLQDFTTVYRRRVAGGRSAAVL